MSKARIAVTVVFAASAMLAQAQQPKPEDQIKLRKSAYALMNYSFDVLDDMAKGKHAFVKDEAVRQADLLAQLSTIPKGFFGEGSDKGETRAKAEVWQNRADFDKKMDRMTQETARLAQVARTGDAAALKKPLADVEAACKACHDDFRAKRRG
jgi:cytochrome c556